MFIPHHKKRQQEQLYYNHGMRLEIKVLVILLRFAMQKFLSLH